MTPWTSACQASLSITNSRSLLKLMSISSVMPSNHLILCRPLLLPPSIFPSIRVFSNESVLCIRWPKYCSFSFSISPSNGYSGLISFRIDRFDLLAVQGTLKSLLQHHSTKASILQCSVFFLIYFLLKDNCFTEFCCFSVKPQHESAICIHISPPFWSSLSSPSPSHPSRLIQSPWLSFLGHAANSHWLSVLRMVM